MWFLSSYSFLPAKLLASSFENFFIEGSDSVGFGV